jgi:RNA polymerase sigma-70 factor, ECF subfamily
VDESVDAVFTAHRTALLGAAYRILGSRVDAEDVVQDSWLRWRGVDPATVREPRSYLFRLVTNAAIDELRRGRARREQYVGPWFPEPVPTGPDASDGTELAETLAFGLLVVLQTLSPVERAVFVLHEAFAFPYAEVASMLGRTEHAVRQLAYRARVRIRDRRPRHPTAPGEEGDVVRRFVAAALGGDLAALLDVLAPEATLWADANGLSEMPREPLVGGAAVARYVASVAPFWPARRRVVELPINGGPGALVLDGDAPFLAFAFELDDAARLAVVHAVRNPDKLVGLLGLPLDRTQLV